MSDVMTFSQVLKISAGYVDGDTRVFNIRDPRSDLTAADIENYSNFIAANNLLIGDKTGAAFGKISLARRVNTTTIKLDID